MKLLLASADLREIRVNVERGLADGVHLSPGMVATLTAQRSAGEALGDLCRVARHPVFVPVRAVREADVLREARALAAISDLIVVEVPLVEDVLGAVHQLRDDGIRVATSLVVTAAQATLAAKVGAYAVSVDVDLIETHGLRAGDLLREIRAVFDRQGAACDIVAMHPRTPGQFADCVMAGVDGIALEEPLLRDLLAHPLTDRGLDQLLRALSHGGRGFA